MSDEPRHNRQEWGFDEVAELANAIVAAAETYHVKNPGIEFDAILLQSFDELTADVSTELRCEEVAFACNRILGRPIL